MNDNQQDYMIIYHAGIRFPQRKIAAATATGGSSIQKQKRVISNFWTFDKIRNLGRFDTVAFRVSLHAAAEAKCGSDRVPIDHAPCNSPVRAVARCFSGFVSPALAALLLVGFISHTSEGTHRHPWLRSSRRPRASKRVKRTSMTLWRLT